MKRKLAAVAVAVGLMFGLTACGEDDICQPYEAEELHADCGYYDNDIWVWYPWITPETGGSPPPHTKPWNKAKSTPRIQPNPNQGVNNKPYVKRDPPAYKPPAIKR